MNYNKLSDSDLWKEYQRLAWQGNKRLERLEKAGMQSGSAYKAALRSTMKYKSKRGSGKRFSMAKPTSQKELRSRINAVKQFLADETSTRTGVRALGSRVGAKLSKMYGFDLQNYEQIKAMFDSALWKKLNQQYGYVTAFNVIASLQKNNMNIKATLEDLAQKGTFFSDAEAKKLDYSLRYYKGRNKLDFLESNEE